MNVILFERSTVKVIYGRSVIIYATARFFAF